MSVLFVAACTAPNTRKVASSDPEQVFRNYVHGYVAPQYFEKNSLAFDARLKLLDMAPAGAQAEIATFAFDNGEVVRRLARHICLAEQRGVNVALLTDSKSGDVVNHRDTFDKAEDSQVVEELYQYMANCGAKVYVHNHFENFVEVLGSRLPNIFLDPAMNGSTIGSFQPLALLKFDQRINSLINKFAGIANEEFRAAGAKVDITPLLMNVKKMGLTALTLIDIAGWKDTSKISSAIEGPTHALNSSYLNLVRDPFWQAAKASQVKAALPKILARMSADPELAALRQDLHRFNRLNHRKLFLVQNADRTEGCMFLGGRNLGDHYLADTDDSFLDGDVMVCRHQSENANGVIGAAETSFAGLLGDLSDHVIGLPQDNQVRLVPADPSFIYSALSVPSNLALAPVASHPYGGSLSVESRSLLPEKIWPDAAPIVGELSLGNATNWHLLKAGWDPATDEIAQNLLGLVQREKRSIYIETAYAEFDEALRNAIEAALARGVHVRIITNSFFISDGGSRLIRITMSHWVEKMKAQYQGAFDYGFATSRAGHMIHFKFAEFSCQSRANGFVRTNLLGSHNFHPRSGRADKEHALLWDQPEERGCTEGFNETLDIMRQRTNMYSALDKSLGTHTLLYYPDLLTELSLVRKQHLKHRSPQNQVLANALYRVFYKPSSTGATLYEQEKVHQILLFLDESGLHDVIGLLL